jgi:hypothetical protein
MPFSSGHLRQEVLLVLSEQEPAWLGRRNLENSSEG